MLNVFFFGKLPKMGNKCSERRTLSHTDIFMIGKKKDIEFHKRKFEKQLNYAKQKRKRRKKKKKKKPCKKRNYKSQRQRQEEKEKKHHQSEIFYAVGELFCLVHDYGTAIKYWVESMTLGNLEATYKIGNWYLSIDIRIAIHYYKSLIPKKHMDAFAMLAKCYFYGYGVDKNKKKAIQLCNEAMKNGSTLAFIFRGDFYEDNKNYNEAAQCYRNAIKQKLTPETIELIVNRLRKYFTLGLGGISKDLNELRFYQNGTFFYYYERNVKKN